MAVTVTVPVVKISEVVKLDAVELPMLGLVVMEYERIVEPYAPAAPEMASAAFVLPYT